MPRELILVIVLALVFEFLNGMRDSSNIVATMISSRAFSPRRALSLTAIAEFLGPFLFGITVAKTIGDDIVNSQVLTLDVLVGCLSGAIIWNVITWFFGIPSSSSHALFGDYRYWCIRTVCKGPLERGRGHIGRLADHNSCQWIIFGGNLLVRGPYLMRSVEFKVVRLTLNIDDAKMLEFD